MLANFNFRNKEHMVIRSLFCTQQQAVWQRRKLGSPVLGNIDTKAVDYARKARAHTYLWFFVLIICKLGEWSGITAAEREYGNRKLVTSVLMRYEALRRRFSQLEDAREAVTNEKLVRRSEGYFARPKKHIQKGYESSFTQRD
ncbi:hypothetical protein YC2023_022331 [Brassica napus]